MSKLTEAWLRDCQSRHGMLAATPEAISIVLARPTLSLNEWNRMHWAKRSRYTRKLSDEIAPQLPPPFVPMPKARITVMRYSVGECDGDNAVGGTKALTDCFVVRSITHPHGLGVIVDDSPAHVMVDVQAIRVARRSEQHTHVRIERAD